MEHVRETYSSHNSTILSTKKVINTFITDDDYYLLLIVFNALNSTVSMFGMVTNTINLAVFKRFATRDSFFTCLLILSSSDFICCLLAFLQHVSTALWIVEIGSDYKVVFPVQPMAMYVTFGNIRTCAFNIPVLVTLYLSIAKCMCVVKPMHFKNMFSFKRTSHFLKGICIFAVVSYIPVYSSTWVIAHYDQTVNITRPILVLTPYRDIIRSVVWTIRDAVPSILSSVVIVICITLMSHALRRSAEFRMSLKSYTLATGCQDAAKSVNDKISSTRNVSVSELQVIKQIIVIALIFIAGNTPKVFVLMTLVAVPDLNFGKRYQNLYLVLMLSRELIENFVSAGSFLIYYKYNSKYRQFLRF